MKAQRGGQQRSEVPFFPFLPVHQSFVHTHLSAGRHKSLILLAAKSDGAQELCDLVQCDLSKGVK